MHSQYSTSYTKSTGCFKKKFKVSIKNWCLGDRHSMRKRTQLPVFVKIFSTHRYINKCYDIYFSNNGDSIFLFLSFLY